MEVFGWNTLGRIGGGRFSDIYKVRKRDAEQTSSRCFAMKIIDPDDEKPPHNVRNEIKILKELNDGERSSNVVNLIDVLFNQIEYGLLFPILDISLGKLLENQLKTRVLFNMDGTMESVKRNTMTLEQVCAITVGLARGLEYIHQHQIIHRDLNLNNVMFSNEDMTNPIIIDFGIAYQYPTNNGLEPPEKKFTDIATGMFKAPELLLSKRDYTNKVDMWALGIILTCLLSVDGNGVFDNDAMFSDLALLSNIIKTFGSPPKDWADCKGLVSFDAMNNSFFERAARPLNEIIPLGFKETSSRAVQIQNVFKGLTEYDTTKRFSATECLNTLC